MTYDEIHPAMREACGAFEMLRRFGFSADDIHWHNNSSEPPGSPEPRGMMFVVLKFRGGEFNIRTGVVDCPYDEWKTRWHAVASALAAGEIQQADLDRILIESEAYRFRRELCVAIRAKGIRIPVFDDVLAKVLS